MAISKRQAVHWMFDVAVAIKGLNGLLEIAGGYFLVFKPGWIGPAVGTWAAALLVHHPANWFAQTVARWGYGLTVDTEHFASAYLIAHGVAKVFIAWACFEKNCGPSQPHWPYSGCSSCISYTVLRIPIR
jgi:uncharacterized membrane protein